MPKEATPPQRRQHAKYERLIEAAKTKAPLPTAVAHPCDETSLAGALEAYRAGLIVPILVGPADKIRKLAKAGGMDIAGVEIVDAPHSQAAAEKAVALVREGKAELLMKGSLHSDELLARGRQARDWAAHGPAHQPRLHHGRADASPDAVHHRRRREHRAGPDGQARHRAERHRSLHGLSGSARPRSPSSRRSRP